MSSVSTHHICHQCGLPLPLGQRIDTLYPANHSNPTLYMFCSKGCVHQASEASYFSKARYTSVVIDPCSLAAMPEEECSECGSWFTPPSALHRTCSPGCFEARTDRLGKTAATGRFKRGARFLIFDRDHHRCQYCGATAADAQLALDHVVPFSAGGRGTASNMQVACKPCNTSKYSNRMASETYHLDLIAERNREAKIDPNLVCYDDSVRRRRN